MTMHSFARGVLLLALPIIALGACTGDDPPAPTPAPTYTVEGLAQKGPFNVGSAVTIQELTNKLDPTGKSYGTTIIDDFGAFKLGTPVGSAFIEVAVDGPFYNEVTVKHTERIILRALVQTSTVDSGVESINVNLLTHLQSARLKKLVTDGQTFAAAETQSRNEVSTALGLPPIGERPEQLSVVGSRAGDGVLLALCVLVEQAAVLLSGGGDSSGPGVPTIVGELRQDLEDGKLDAARLVKARDDAKQLLATGMYSYQAGVVSPSSLISEALKKYYADRGLTVTVPDWNKYIQK